MEFDRNRDECIAHVRESDKEKQSVQTHLTETGHLSSKFASKIGLAACGEILGLLHDIGKYSDEFQKYIQSAAGFIDPDTEEYVNSKDKKGKIDHSSAGSQVIFEELSDKGAEGIFAAQILSICLASHHSGLIDCISPDGTDTFTRRIKKSDELTHRTEILEKIDHSIKERILQLLYGVSITSQINVKIQSLLNKNDDSKETLSFKKGLLARYLLSCLLDADRLNSADFESPIGAKLRNNSNYVSWEILNNRLNKKIEEFAKKEDKTLIDEIRQDISDHCFNFAQKPRGLYQLTVPTGGGKTLSSLRFAINHAQTYNMDRIVYVIPYTSIIDQNADEVRKILEDKDDNGKYSDRVVLEHHSNLTPDEESWKQKLLSEDWDAPIVFTTNVQVLEALFGHGTKNARRMHQLANSVLIFDEIQTLPIRCVHMFNVAIRFLVENCRSTVVLCTATQPLLDKLDKIDSKTKRSLPISPGQQMMPDIKKLFDDLKRVNVLDKRRDEGWAEEEIADFTLQELCNSNSVLIIVNTKKSAFKLYDQFDSNNNTKVYHLSTNMCPSHRMDILAEIRTRLDKKEKTICVSTQLIEAGVDIDFDIVIRYSAGLDSIAQAAGRCNRHGKRRNNMDNLIPGNVYIINPKEENLNHLPDIAIGKEKSERILGEFKINPVHFDNDVIGLAAMEQYYQYYFFSRKDEMCYPVSKKTMICRDDNLFQLLSVNRLSIESFERIEGKKPVIPLQQAFMTASELFKAIDSPTQGVIVYYGDRGEEIINGLCSSPDFAKEYKLLKEAQRYSVNLYRYQFDELAKEGAIHEIQTDAGIYYIDKEYYSKEFGWSKEPVTFREVLIDQGE